LRMIYPMAVRGQRYANGVSVAILGSEGCPIMAGINCVYGFPVASEKLATGKPTSNEYIVQPEKFNGYGISHPSTDDA
jgi:hypothetical protein